MEVSKQLQGPAYRVETPRLVARCMNPKDAPLFARAVDENLDHLRPWLSWTRHEPRSLEARVERIRELRSRFDAGRDFVYGTFNIEESMMLGACGLQTRQGPDCREIAYWIDRDYTGQGLTTEIASALIRVAFEVDGVRRVEIHCDPRNEPSAAIPRKLGFAHEATLDRRKPYPGGHWGDLMIWTLFFDEYRDCPACDAPVRAYDAMGRRLL